MILESLLTCHNGVKDIILYKEGVLIQRVEGKYCCNIDTEGQWLNKKFCTWNEAEEFLKKDWGLSSINIKPEHEVYYMKWCKNYVYKGLGHNFTD